MNKLFGKKKNELKRASKSGNLREADQNAENGYKTLDFLSWLGKHLQLREGTFTAEEKHFKFFNALSGTSWQCYLSR